MKTTNKLLIVGGVVLLSMALLVVNKLSKSYEVIKSSNEGIISQANRLIGSPKVVFLFGGLKYANPDWMFSQLSEDVLKNYTFVIIPHSMSIQKAYNFYKAGSGKSLDYKDMIVIGYSAGGKRVQEGYSSDFRLVGLIDPSTDSNLSSKKYGKNTIMIYNPDNWTGLQSVARQFPNLKESIVSSGGEAKQLDLSHKEFVKHFFEKYI